MPNTHAQHTHSLVKKQGTGGSTANSLAHGRRKKIDTQKVTHTHTHAHTHTHTNTHTHTHTDWSSDRQTKTHRQSQPWNSTNRCYAWTGTHDITGPRSNIASKLANLTDTAWLYTCTIPLFKPREGEGRLKHVLARGVWSSYYLLFLPRTTSLHYIIASLDTF